MPDHNKIVDKITREQLIKLQPKRAVDAGAGSGSYGKMIRECLDKCEIIGIEVWKPYIDGYNLNKIYDEVIEGDISKLIKDERIFGDLIIFGDVLEHLPKEDIKIVRQASKKFKFILINSPIGFQPQHTGNPYETHLCGISKEDFLDLDIVEYHDFKPDHMMFNLLIRGEKNGG